MGARYSPNETAELHALSAGLLELYPTVTATAEQLCAALDDVQDYQQADGFRLPRLPWYLFHDLVTDGPVYTMLQSVIQHALMYSLSFPLVDRDSATELHTSLSTSLIESGHLQPPRIYVPPYLSRPDLEIDQLGGLIIDEIQGATHIIDSDYHIKHTPNPVIIGTDSGSRLFLMHQPGVPPSLNRWVPEISVQKGALSRLGGCLHHETPVRVSLEWLTDSIRHGEWLDEYDYSLPDDDPSVIRLAKAEFGYHVRSISGPLSVHAADINSSVSKKRRVAPSPTIPAAKKSRSEFPSPATAAAVEMDQSPEPDVKPTVLINGVDEVAPPMDNVFVDENRDGSIDDKIINQVQTPNMADQFPYRGPILTAIDDKVQSNTPLFPVVVPCYSTWFDTGLIHANERKSLHELFAGGPQQEQLYMKYRNFIVNAYRANPRIHFSATSCRKLIAGDALAIVRIHNFLEQWGIINYHVDPGTIPAYAGPGNPDFAKGPVYSHSPYNGVHPIASSAPMSLPKAISNNCSSVISASVGGMSTANLSSSCRICSSCLDATYYAKMTDSSYQVCSQCYTDQRFPAHIDQNSFKRVEMPGDDASWPEFLLQRLVEGIDRYGEDWDSVAEFVGSDKTSSDCLQCFIQLPIEEGFNEEKHSEQSNPVTPFADSANPILAQVAFLASVINPQQAAALAKSALDSRGPTSASSDDLPNSDTPLAVGTTVLTTFGHGQLGTVRGPVRPDGIVPVEMNMPGDNPIMLYAHVCNLTPVLANPSQTDAETMSQISGQCLVSAALKAHEISQFESRTILGLVGELVETQMKKIEIKLKQFEEVQSMLVRQRETIEIARQEVFAERIELAHARMRLQSAQAAVASPTVSGSSTIPSLMIDDPPTPIMQS